MVAKNLSRFCFKTKLCMFYSTQNCTKGAACKFVHAAGEQQPLPDLSCTKLCRSMVLRGYCTQPNCKYAHDKAELRRDPREDRRPQAAAATDKARDRRLPDSRPAEGNAVSLLDEGSDLALSFKRSVTDSVAVSAHVPEVPEIPEVGPGLPGRQCTDPALAGQTATEDFAPMSRQTTQDAEAGNAKTRNKFFRTRMCVHFSMGLCRKIHSCSYAHSPEELRPAPDLCFTKLCQSWTETGTCSAGATCSFAHSLEELRGKNTPGASPLADSSGLQPTGIDGSLGTSALNRAREIGPHAKSQVPAHSSSIKESARPDLAAKMQTLSLDLWRQQTDCTTMASQGDCQELQEARSSSGETEDEQATRGFRVKNTFVDMEETMSGAEPAMRRCISAPALLSPSEGEEELPEGAGGHLEEVWKKLLGSSAGEAQQAEPPSSLVECCHQHPTEVRELLARLHDEVTRLRQAVSFQRERANTKAAAATGGETPKCGR